MMKPPFAIDLFSGCGGVSEGLRQAGCTVVAAIEIDALAVETYSHNHKNVEIWPENIQKVAPKEIMSKINLQPGDIDIIAACAPCQGFSRLRTRNRINSVIDSRNDLVLEIIPFISFIKPKFIMLENVPGIQFSSQMNIIKNKLKHIGYFFDEKILDVVDFGVPQHRRRHIFIASKFGPPFFPKRDNKKLTVHQTIGELPSPNISSDPLHNILEKRASRISQLIASIPKNGGSRSALPYEQQLMCHKHCNGFYDVYGRMSWDKPAPTITSGFVNPSKGRFLHPIDNRTITPREAALLQSFPSNYYFSMRKGKYGAAELIGNAVPPEFAKRQAQALLYTS